MREEEKKDIAPIGLFCGTRRGFGFVTPAEGGEDIYIPESETGGAFHGDTVSYRLLGPAGDGRRAWGRVEQVMKRGVTELVGTFEPYKKNGFVIPDDQKLSFDVFIPAGQSMNAVDGHKVVVKIRSYGGPGQNPEGTVLRILGHKNDPGVDIQSIAMAYGLPQEFPETVMRQTARIPSQVTEADRQGRLDLRETCMVTIDGEDAKDLDDAVSLSKEGDIYRLGVHIADVSHYVGEGTPLDKEALKRGTSVYLVDRVIPMLPHALSNGICSLNVGEDRLALSCRMEIDASGDLVSYEVVETVVRVDRRMSYTEVNQILNGPEGEAHPDGTEMHSDDAESHAAGAEMHSGAIQSHAASAETHSGATQMHQASSCSPEIRAMLREMDSLAELLRRRRHERGAIDFDFPESKILLDAKGRPVDVRPYERNRATRLIEDFMLMANETIAEGVFWQELPFLYRTHEKPAAERMKKLAVFLTNFGQYLKGQPDKIKPKEIQKLLDRIAGTPEEALLSRMALRSLQQARYGTQCLGHFGLASRYYCHFTSPIRRYPDLQIHRIIKENLHGKLDVERISHYEQLLPQVASQSSVTERRADEAERETEKVKKAQYMKQFLGAEFAGVISGVTNWGLYVELPNTVEGMVRVSDLEDDYYLYDETRMELRGERDGRVYRLGEKIRVQVIRVDAVMHTVNFIPCTGEEEQDGEEGRHETDCQ